MLETIHTLATGRSFRTPKLDSLIQLGKHELTVFAQLINGQKVGFSKQLRKPAQVVVDSDKVRSWELVARALPTLVLDASAFELVDGGPRIRRSYLDWGVFHVEPNFIGVWRQFMRCLGQRNHLLKTRSKKDEELEAWTVEFCSRADAIDLYRANYLEELLPYFSQVLDSLVPNLAPHLSLNYQRGWDSSENLAAVTDHSLASDFKYGATQHGPHRAEIALQFAGAKAAEVLSRGQSKLLVIALKVAQGMLLRKFTNRQCTYLVDDLASELDAKNRRLVLDLLISQECQLFLSAVSKYDLGEALDSSLHPATFHVERGIISA